MTATIAGVLAQMPAAIPPADKVSPGVLGFAVVFVLALATWLLIRSMVGHMRKVRFSPDPADTDDDVARNGGSAATDGEAGATDGEAAAGEGEAAAGEGEVAVGDGGRPSRTGDDGGSVGDRP